MTTKKYKVNKDGCISCWLCVGMCPEVFAFDENNKSYVKEQPSNESTEKDAEAAMNGCPVRVITLETVDDDK